MTDRDYADYRLSREEWLRLELMHEVLKVHYSSLKRCFLTGIQEPASAQQTFSSERYPTVWRTIPVLEFLQESWRNMAAHPRFASVADALYSGLDNLEKWYHKLDDTHVYFVCLGTLSFSFLSESHPGNSAGSTVEI